MKTHNLLLIAILVFIGGRTWGQGTKEDIIEIRPFGENTYPNKKIQKGLTVKFKIENVNFLKVSGSKVESKGSNISFDISSDALQELLGESVKEVVRIDTGNHNDNKGIAGIDNEFLTEEGFVHHYLKFLNQLSSIEKATALEGKLKNILGDDVFIQDIGWVKSTATAWYGTVYPEGDDIYKKIDRLMHAYVLLKDAYDDINKLSSRQTSTVSGELKGDNGLEIKVSGEKASQTLQSNYSEEFELAKKAIAVFNNETKKQEIIQKAQEGVALYYQIQRSDFVHYTDAIQLNDDFVTLTPKLRDAEDKVIYEFEPITLKTKAGVRVNFSTGYLLSFRGDEEFDYKRDSTGAIVGVENLGDRKLTHGLGALAHVFWDCGGNTQFGISSGISINTDAKLNFYGGLSAGFIEKNRLIFTAGASFVNIQQLNRSNLDKENKFVSSQYTEINYIDRYQPAFFFGVTYNLVNKK